MSELDVLRRVWKDIDTPFIGLGRKTVETDRFHREVMEKGNWDEIKRFLRRYADQNVYANVCGFKGPRATNDNAVWGPWMYADLDARDPRKIELKPTIAIQSSPGRYVGLWRLKDGDNDSELNRKLTWFLCKDKSGWEGAKVLRLFTGVHNYKYTNEPVVKLLWDNGPEYSRAEVEEFVKPVKLIKPKPVIDRDLGYYKLKLGGRVCKMIRDGTIITLDGEEDRSKVSNFLISLMAEKGVPQEIAARLMEPWNDITGKYKDDNRLEADIERIYEKHETVKDNEREEDRPLSMAEVGEQDTEWVWMDYLARGEITILEGDPGIGKSFLAQMVSKCICDGEKLPTFGKATALQGKVLHFDSENAMGKVTKKRLMYNGLQNPQNFYQYDRTWSLDDDDDMDRVYRWMNEIKPVLVVFDVINRYLGNTDSSSTKEVTHCIDVGAQLARDFNCAVLMLRHLTKSSKDRAIYRGTGSIAFSGGARLVFTTGNRPDGDEGEHVITTTKNNLGPWVPALTWSILKMPNRQARFQWGDFDESITSDDVVAPTNKGNRGMGEQSQKATDFLKQMLDEGPQDYKEIVRISETKAISLSILKKAADLLGIVRLVTGKGEKRVSMWSLPPSNDQK